MNKKILTEKKLWNNVKNLLGNKQIVLGQHWSYNLYNDPKRLAFVLSRYKFAAKMISKNNQVLELGCSEGIGVPILSEFAKNYTGIDIDKAAIQAAKENWGSDKIMFIEDDFLSKKYGSFDAVVSLDVVEHIEAKREKSFFEAIYSNLNKDGIGIIGTPNLNSAKYASSASKIGHVNLFDAERLKFNMQKLFHNIFILGINDEVVHTGFLPMTHYLICLGCNKRVRKQG